MGIENHANSLLVKATTSSSLAEFDIDMDHLVEGNVQLCMSIEALKYKA